MVHLLHHSAAAVSALRAARGLLFPSGSCALIQVLMPWLWGLNRVGMMCIPDLSNLGLLLLWFYVCGLLKYCPLTVSSGRMDSFSVEVFSWCHSPTVPQSHGPTIPWCNCLHSWWRKELWAWKCFYFRFPYPLSTVYLTFAMAVEFSHQLGVLVRQALFPWFFFKL